MIKPTSTTLHCAVNANAKAYKSLTYFIINSTASTKILILSYRYEGLLHFSFHEPRFIGQVGQTRGSVSFLSWLLSHQVVLVMMTSPAYPSSARQP